MKQQHAWMIATALAIFSSAQAIAAPVVNTLPPIKNVVVPSAPLQPGAGGIDLAPPSIHVQPPHSGIDTINILPPKVNPAVMPPTNVGHAS